MADKKSETATKSAPEDAAADAVARGSSDADKSTYREVKPDTDERPAPGRQVEQERGGAS